MSSLSLAEAEAVAAAARAHAQSLGLAVAIAVLDLRGDDVVVVRMDGARYTAFEVARGKALASASFRQPSAALREMGDAPVGRRVNALNHERMVYSQGAVPVVRAGAPIGAVGVSGALPAQDEEIAAAGAAALV